MSFRQLMIAKQCHLSIENSSVKIAQENHENRVPLEDISVIVIESNDVTMSAAFFGSCASKSIPVLICGQNHIPTSLTVAINSHYRPFSVLSMQMNSEESVKEIVTEQLLKKKIANQLSVMKLIKASDESIGLMSDYLDDIIGYDEQNREGTAAKVFFNQLYGSEFTRFEDDPINASLNYGYAIFAACLSRFFCAYGFNLSLGVNHCGQTNPLNLVYDFIEPFRAIVDYYLFSNKDLLSDKLNIQTKKELVNLLNAKVRVCGKMVSVQYAMEMIVKSYLRIIENGEMQLDLPSVIEIDFDSLNEPI